MGNTQVTIGHNSGFAAKELVSIVERVERLNEEKQGLQDDIKEIFDEAKNAGFDNKIIRRVLALRKLHADARKEISELTDLYMATLDEAENAQLAKSVAAGTP